MDTAEELRCDKCGFYFLDCICLNQDYDYFGGNNPVVKEMTIEEIRQEFGDELAEQMQEALNGQIKFKEELDRIPMDIIKKKYNLK